MLVVNLLSFWCLFGWYFVRLFPSVTKVMFSFNGVRLGGRVDVPEGYLAI